jgi:hypothetical protein
VDSLFPEDLYQGIEDYPQITQITQIRVTKIQ